MRKTVKLFNINNENYLVSADPIKVGDLAVVTVGGEYPNIVKCENEMVLNLITDSKLSLTKAFKVVAEPNQLDLSIDELSKIEENQWFCLIEEDESKLDERKDWGFSLPTTKKVKVIVE